MFNTDVQVCGRKKKQCLMHAIYAGQQKHIYREDSKPPGKVSECHKLTQGVDHDQFHV
jgi:hypothetical protein